MEIYIARQPIFNKDLKVCAYELLYRSGKTNVYEAVDGDVASSELISNSLLLFGLEKLTRGHRAFINFTAKLLEDDVAALLPKNRVVVEVLEDVIPEDSLVKACQKIKDAGYILALDDFVYEEKYRPLLNMTDIIKVDFLQTKGKDRKSIMHKINRPNIAYLAEKVETREDFDEAVKMGYTFFQGFFFSKPEIIASGDIPAFKLSYMRLMQEINKPDIDFDQIELLIKSDLALSYRLLTFINSAAFGFKSEISSIKQALALLGQKEIIKWFSLVSLKNIGDDKPEELILTAICRARFCELLAPRLGLKNRAQDIFLMGLFSLVDAFLGQPLDALLKDLPLPQDVKEALTTHKGPMGDILKLVLAYEKGKVEETLTLTEKLNIEEKEVVDYYIEALELANQIFE